MKKSIGIMFLLVLLLLSPVFAAGGKEAAPVAASGELSGEITIWHSFTQGGRLDTIQKTADSFMQLHPKVKITIQTFSWSDFYTKWTTGFASGNLPDLSTALPNHVVEMIDADAIIPLDNLVDSMGRDRFAKAPLVEMTKDGSLYAIPLYSHAQVMWYRTDLLEKYNLAVPTTWDEFYNAAATITKGEGGAVYGTSFPFGTNDMMGTRWLNFYVRSAGETLLTKDGKANLTSKAAIDGIKYWVKMYQDISPKDSINYNVLDQATLFYQGKTAFDFNSGFHIGGVNTNSPALLDHIDSAPVPSVSKVSAKAGYETSNIPMVIWKQSKHPEISEAFIKYLYEPQNYVPFLLSVPVGMLPALPEIAQDPAMMNNPTVVKFANSLKVISNAVGEGTAIGMEYGPRPEAGLLTSQGVIETMFQNIIVKGVAVETAAKDAENKLNDLFETVQ
ncbi:MAG: sugar ABC transporter substrate-binding protein [Spirochaetia bacterium]|nr:sugar ABC transporter substrate-binding protein [Spirochaetia bacterium]